MSDYMLAPGEGIPNEEASPNSATQSASASPSISPSPTDLKSPHAKHLSPDAIAGIVIAAVVIALLLAAFLFLLSRHTGMLKLLRPSSASPHPAPQHGTPQPQPGPGSSQQAPYSPDMYASPPPPQQIAQFEKPPHDIAAQGYRSQIQSRHLSELSSPDSGHQKAFATYQDGTSYDDLRRQTVSPSLLR